MAAHELTLAECEAWATELGYDPDWKRLLQDAGIGPKITNRDNIKSKWRMPVPLRNQQKLRAALERAEDKRGPTKTGQVIRGLEEWQQLGERLAARPNLFLAIKKQIEEILATMALATSAEGARAKILAVEAGLNIFEPSSQNEEPELPTRGRAKKAGTSEVHHRR